MRKFALLYGLFLVHWPAWGAGPFQLESPDLQRGGRIPETHVLNTFGCTGQNVSPALQWSNAPEGTKSFAVTVYDPDAPTGSGWWHWVVFNLPASATSLPQGAGIPKGEQLPAGAIQGRTDFGQPGYGGPCPPEGDKPHRYQFTVHALSTEKLPLDENASAAMVGFYIHNHSLGKAVLTAQFGR